MKTHLIWIPAVVALTAIACNGDETEDFPFFVPEKKPDRPLGPFKRHPLNPVLNSGHETTLFPFREGVAALVIRDGMEHNTNQYAPDWVNFEIASIVELMPGAGGPFVPDAFTDTKDGRGITWGISHFTNTADDWSRNHSILTRFDCELSLDLVE